MVIHMFFDVGQVHQGHKPDKQFAFKVFLGGCGHAPHVQAILQISKELFNQIPSIVTPKA